MAQHNLDSIMRKIQGLLAKADHPNTPEPEADACRAKAEGMMFQYKITELTEAKEDSAAGKPVWHTTFVANVGSEFSDYYRMIAGSILQHVGAKGIIKYENGNAMLHAVGFDGDMRYLDVLMTSCILEFSKRLEPRYDEKLSTAENIYNMRHAGMERKRIAKVVFGDWTTENEMKMKNRKVTNIFKAECRRRGEDPDILLGRGNNVKTYRQSYADGFVNTIYSRLARMRSARGEDSGALVLASLKERVEEAFYEEYPQYRPSGETRTYTDPRANCEACRKAKSGYCRAHSYLKPRRIKERSFNSSAYERGGDAARAVDIGPGGTGKMGDSGRGQIGE